MPADFYSITEPCTVNEDENVKKPIYDVKGNEVNYEQLSYAERCRLSQERIARLEEVGFDLSEGKVSKNKKLVNTAKSVVKHGVYNSLLRLEELKAYKEEVS
jgi:hypothetical protein